MYRFSIIAILFAFLLTFSNCNDDQSADTEPVEFETAPSAELSTMINQTPSDFTWGYFYDNVRVSAVPGSQWSGSVELSVFQVEGNEVTNRATTTAVETNIDELSGELSTENMFPGSEWIPSSTWFPGSEWVPGDSWTPSEVENAAITNTDLATNETLLVVYAQIAGGSDREVQTRPFGIIFQPRQ